MNDERYSSDDEENILNFKDISNTPMGKTSVKYTPDPCTILGHGLTAFVYPGYHFGIDKPVAVKFIQKQYIRVENDQVNEFKIWKEIDQNVNIIRLYDSFEHPKNGLFLAMEKAERTFRKQIEKFDPSRDEIITWLHQITKAVGYLHGKGVIHRDIKPDNILMVLQDGKLVAKLADFGVSKMLSSSEITSTFSNANGTTLWMAPEALENQSIQKFKNTRMLDIYALGMTMYFGLSKGGHPFAKSQTEDIINRVVPRMVRIGAKPQLLNRNDNRANDLLQKMMQRFPEYRPEISEVLSHCLFWDWKSEQQFLIRAAICFATPDCAEKEKIKDDFDNEYTKFYNETFYGESFNWINIAESKGFVMEDRLFISQTRKKPTSEYRDGTSASKFVKLFRDKYVHHPDMIPEAAEWFSQSDGSFCEEKYVKFMTSLCPGITGILYAYLKRHVDRQSILSLSKIYFPWKFRCSAEEGNGEMKNVALAERMETDFEWIPENDNFRENTPIQMSTSLARSSNRNEEYLSVDAIIKLKEEHEKGFNFGNFTNF